MSAEKIGTVLKELRKSRGFTLMQVEELTGVSNPYLSQVENGRSVPGVEVLRKLAKGYGTTVSAILKKAGIK